MRASGQLLQLTRTCLLALRRGAARDGTALNYESHLAEPKTLKAEKCSRIRLVISILRVREKQVVNTFPKGLSDMTSPRVVPPLISQFLSRLRDDGLINKTQRDLN